MSNIAGPPVDPGAFRSSKITGYDTLRELIIDFNNEMKNRRLSTIDVTLVDLRDAIAHGRVSSSSPDDTMRLLKFDKPDKEHRVRVAFNQQMDEAWFESQIQRVHQAVQAVYRVMPE
jgi:hypothetical protein